MEGEPLVEKVMENGKLLKERENWQIARERFLSDFERLPEHLKTLQKGEYEVQINPQLEPENYIKTG